CFALGMHALLKHLGLRTLIAHGRKQAQEARHETSLPERFGMAVDELGPTFLRLGHILATRHDLLSPEWTTELAKLHNHVNPLPWDTVLAEFEQRVGATPDEIFAYFDKEPLAAASMAQVYRARLEDGQEVVVKIQRPHLEQTIDADLRLLGHIAHLLQENSTQWARFKPVNIVEYLARSMRHELDFNNEGRNCERIGAQFADDPTVVIPKIYWQWSNRYVLVQEYIAGWEPTSAQDLRNHGVDPDLVAQHGAQAMLKMILEEGEYHADPHPGNLLAMSENRVGFIDFGMIGRLSQKRKKQLLVL